MIVTAREVLAALFEDEHHPLYATHSLWLTEDRRFRTFAQQYRGKIRRKLRNISDDAGGADLKFELEIARWLLQESRFEIAYEMFDAREGGPDYTVTYRVNMRFNVEVRRIRTLEVGEERVRKLVETLVDKSRQMPSNAINLLVMSDGGLPGDDLNAAATILRGLAERKAEEFFMHRGYKNATDFLRKYRQLSAVFFKAEAGLLWTNSLAKHPLPREIGLALERLPN
ncbi:MAG: hypothetical protein ABI700_05255 [Chloroflexota bacterium]